MKTTPLRIDQSERALKTLTLAMLVGLVALFAYAVESKTWAHSLTSFGTGVVVAAAAVLVGGLLGFLFGIPRTAQKPSTGGSTTHAATDSSGAAPDTSTNGTDYQPNTNLEQISDWLTKILVGVGLIQVRAIGDKLYAISGGVASALSDTGDNHSFALALILFYAISGFLLGYLWTRLYLPNAFRDADRAELDLLKTRVEQADLRSRDAQAASLGTGKGGTDEKKMLFATSDVIAPGDSSDPWKGRLGGQSTTNGRQLKAEVKPIPGSSGLFAIRLTVSSLNPQTSPLTGAVQFFLHPTFKVDKPIITVGPSGIAELNLTAWGAFTVGAVADNGQTKLELDLSELDTAPLEFRNR